jgi:hypothetical protein
MGKEEVQCLDLPFGFYNCIDMAEKNDHQSILAILFRLFDLLSSKSFGCSV